MTSSEIKDFRNKNQLTQAQLADIVGSSIRAVQSWEQNQRNIPLSAIKLMMKYEDDHTNNICSGVSKEDVNEKPSNPDNQNAMLKAEIEYLKGIIDEKERLIQVLMKNVNQ